MSWEVSPLSASSWWFSSHWRVTGVFRQDIPYSFSASQDISQQLAALNGLYTRAYFLLGIAAQFKDDWGRQTATTSNPEVASVNYNNFEVGQTAASEKEIQFTVYQLASPQVNLGQQLEAEAAAAINTGTNAFHLTVGGTSHDLMVLINAGDNNEAALNKVAQAINDAATGVTATLVRFGDKVRLCLQGSPGTGQSFSLADIAGNAVRASGADTVSQTAKEARFLVNGASYVQDSNLVSLFDDRLEVSLKGTGEAVITMDQGAPPEMVSLLFRAMNDFSAYVEKNSYLDGALKEDWTRLVEHYAVTLSPFGAEASRGGELGLNTRILEQALESWPQAVMEAFGGDSGLAGDVSAFMAHILTAPGVSLLAPADQGAGFYFPPERLSPWFQVAPASFSQLV